MTESGAIVEEDENEEEDLHGFNFKQLKFVKKDCVVFTANLQTCSEYTKLNH